MAPPAWLHNKLSREATEELVTTAGLDNGRFLVRTREGKPGEYVLCVVFKGKPTHHLIGKNPSGDLMVNKKTFGGHKKIADLINELSTKTAGWPVPLDKPVARAGGAPPVATKKTSGKKAAGGGAKKAGGVYVHKGISREEAEAKVTAAGLQDGRFLLRTREGKPGEYVLCVCFKGKPTHHLMGKNPDGIYIINKKKYGDFKKPAQLIAHLSKKGPGWPVALDKPVYVESDSSGGNEGAAAAAKEAKESALAQAESEKAEEAAAAPPAAEEPAPAPEAAAEEPAPAPEAAAEEPAPTPEAAAEEPAPTPEAAAEEPAPAPAAPANAEDTRAQKAAARGEANAANALVAAKKAELEDLREQALLGKVTVADMPKKVTPGLARAVIQMGKRLHELEMKMGQLGQLMESLIGHAQRLDAQAVGM